METVEFGDKGKLYSFTTSLMPSLHFEPPYTVGWIALEEGIKVFARIERGNNQNLVIGMEMELIIDELWQEGDKSVVGYKFRPKG